MYSLPARYRKVSRALSAGSGRTTPFFLMRPIWEFSPVRSPVIDPQNIQAGLFSTHVFPLSVVMEFLAQESGTRVTLLGIQPDRSEPDKGLSG